ncbi:MAG TPA: hypothetical protein VLE97_01810 [Gaiellaceae bacterium]|nr:hypothetical protein [Gaiellaceae bacterium]
MATLDFQENQKKRNIPVMGALASDANAFRGLAQPLIRDNVTSGVAGPAVTAYQNQQANDALTGINVPRTTATPAAPQPPPDTTVGPPRYLAGQGGPVARAVQTAATAPVSATGRALGYGRTVNGVASFDNTDIAALNKVNTLSRADPGIGGGIGTAANGGVTPELGSGIGAPARAIAGRDVGAAARAANANAQAASASDIASIASRDPRSVLGSAARNAEVEANSVGGKRGNAALANALTSLYGGATAPVDIAAKQGTVETQNAGETERENIQQQGGIAREYVARTAEPQRVSLADGTLGLLGPDGVVRQARGSDGNPVKQLEGKPPQDLTAYGKFLSETTSKLLGADPLTGNIVDPNDPKKTRKPTPDEIEQATVRARGMAEKAFGPVGATGQGATPASTGGVAPPEGAAAFLKANPQYKAQFDAKYGVGSADKLLKG